MKLAIARLMVIILGNLQPMKKILISVQRCVAFQTRGRASYKAKSFYLISSLKWVKLVTIISCSKILSRFLQFIIKNTLWIPWNTENFSSQADCIYLGIIKICSEPSRSFIFSRLVHNLFCQLQLVTSLAKNDCFVLQKTINETLNYIRFLNLIGNKFSQR